MTEYTVHYGPDYQTTLDGICGFTQADAKLIRNISDRSGNCTEVYQGPNGTVAAISSGMWSKESKVKLYQDYAAWETAHDAQVIRMAKLTGRM